MTCVFCHNGRYYELSVFGPWCIIDKLTPILRKKDHTCEHDTSKNIRKQSRRMDGKQE